MNAKPHFFMELKAGHPRPICNGGAYDQNALQLPDAVEIFRLHFFIEADFLRFFAVRLRRGGRRSRISLTTVRF